MTRVQSAGVASAAPWLPRCELLRLDGAGGRRLGLRSQVPHLWDEQKSATSFLTGQWGAVVTVSSGEVLSNIPLTMLPQVKWHRSCCVSGIQLEGLSQAIMKVQPEQVSPLWSIWEGSTYTLTLTCLLAESSFCGLSAEVCLSSRQMPSWLKGSVYSNVWNGMMLLTMSDIS